MHRSKQSSVGVIWWVVLVLVLVVGTGCSGSIENGLGSTNSNGVSSYSNLEDRDGNGAILPPAGVPVEPFIDDSAGRKYGYIDVRGTTVLDPKYDAAYSFQDGLALVILQGRKTVIGLKGEIKVRFPAHTREVLPPREGRIWFRNANHKWGLMDAAGGMLIAPVYDAVDDFSEGMAAVNCGARQDSRGEFMEGGKWGFVDREGKLVIPLEYDLVDSFSNGLAHVLHEGVKFIDSSRVIRLGESGWPLDSVINDFTKDCWR
jgi:hypothetical protein